MRGIIWKYALHLVSYYTRKLFIQSRMKLLSVLAVKFQVNKMAFLIKRDI